MKRVLVVDFEDSFVYNIVEALRQEGVEPIVVRAVEISASTYCDLSAIILSPGGKLPKDYPDIRHFVERYYRELPILGICLGFQLLCDYFGAEIYHIDRPLHGDSASLTISAPSDPIFSSVTQGCSVGLYHSWGAKLTADLPLISLATDSRGVVMAMKHSELPIYGMQFHPESIISGDDGKQMLHNWVAMI